MTVNFPHMKLLTLQDGLEVRAINKIDTKKGQKCSA
jgi:hypothetical protein